MSLFSDQGEKLRNAAKEGNLNGVAKQLRKGADVNAKDENGLTPLHLAAFNPAAKDIAELLITKGADVSVKTTNDYTPLHAAVFVNAKDTAELLIAHGAEVNIQAAEGGELKVIVDNKENTTSANGYTPLHMAAFCPAAKDTAELLITKGADVNARAANGYTPLHTAAFINNNGVVESLIAHGADVNARAKDGTTPYDIAIHFGRKDAGEALKRHQRGDSQSDDAELTSLISLIGRRDLLGPAINWDKLLGYGERAILRLIPLLDSSDVNIVADSAKLLGRIGAKQAIPKLLALSKSQWVEVHQASLEALARLDKKDSETLELNRRNPFEQIGRLWTAIIQGRQKLYPPDILHAYCAQAISEMPNLKFSSKNDEARAWGMLGSLLFKSMNPGWPGGFDGTKPCPDARRCYEEALRCEPGDSWWEGWVKRFS